MREAEIIQPRGTAKKRSKSGTKVLVMALFIGRIALALKPSIKWIKGQLLHMEGAAQQNSLKEQNRSNWCADVLESESISDSDYTYCEDIWKD
jgi:hypothetical protein